MKFLTRMAVLFYVTLVLFLGTFILIFVTNVINFSDVTEFLSVVYSDMQLRKIIGIVASTLLVFNYIFYQLFAVNVHRDKIIAFNNPAGIVTVSLMALEDLIKRKILKLSEIKEAKTSIIAKSKKGLYVTIKLILRSDVNIPDLTSKVQDLVKRKIQDVIGIEEPINIAVYVGKIVVDQIKEKHPKENTGDKYESNVPFQGYRA